METARIAPIRLDREDEKKMLPCRFFSNGYCHKGNRCRFYHPLNTNLGSIIRVPPLPSGFGPGTHANANSSPTGVHDAGQRTVRPVPPPPPSPQQRMREQRLSSTMAMTPPSIQQQRQGPSQQYVQQLQPSPRMMTDYSALQRPPATLVHPGYNSPEFDFSLTPMGQHHIAQSVPQYAYNNAQPPQAPQAYEPQFVMPHQETLFAHIDWTEFLAPGQQPPPPTLIPEEHRQSPRGGPDGKTSCDDSDEAPSTSVSNEDMPPEGRNRKLSAREELQMKVKQIADDIAQEQVAPIQSLDSFLQNFGYNGMLPKLPKLKKLGREVKKVQEFRTKASGDAAENKPPKAPEQSEAAASLPTTSDDRFNIRNMAEALIEIYVASEREKRENQFRSGDSLTSQELM